MRRSDQRGGDRGGVAACADHTFALKGDGRLLAWGSLSDLPTGVSNTAALAAGVAHSLVLQADVAPVFPPEQVALGNPQLNGTGFHVSMPTRNGKVYCLDYTDSPAGNNGTALPLVAGNGGVMTLTDPAATVPQRFYRVRQW